MILIVSTPADLTAQAVERRLRSRGVKVVLFDTGRFPAEARITVSYRDSQPRYAIRMDGQVLRFDDVTSIWFRRPNRYTAHPSITDAEVRAVVEALGGVNKGAAFVTGTGGEKLPEGVDPKSVRRG